MSLPSLVAARACDPAAAAAAAASSGRVALVRAAFLSDGAPLRPIDETVRLLGHGVAAAAADVVQQPVHARVVDAYDCGALVEQGVPLARWLTAAGLSVRVAADLRLVEAALPSSRPQSTNCLLMVAPTAFSFNAEAAVDNAFMAGSAGEEGGAAGVRSAVLREHAGLVATLRRAGVTVHLFAHEEAHGTPDAVFCNNWQSTCADTLALYPLRCSNRNRERRPELVNFLRSRGYARELDLTAPPPPGGALEGTGSLVFDHVLGCAYLARSERSSEPLAARAAAALGFTRLHAFDAADEAGVPVYHTNVLLSVGTGWAVVCSECVVGEAARAGLEAALARGGREVVRITRSQMAAFCGNVLEVRDGDGLPCVAMSTAAHDAFTGEQRAALLRHTAALLHAPVPTLERVGGGGVRCCIGELF